MTTAPTTSPSQTTSTKPKPKKRNTFYLYNSYSAGGQAVRKGLGFALFRMGTAYGTGSLLINWGGRFSEKDIPETIRIINRPRLVDLATDKLAFLQTLTEKGVQAPEVTGNLSVAMGWVDKGITAFGRARRGSAGTDICLFSESPFRYMESEFWSLYKKKAKEFRVHVMNSENPKVFFVQQKVLRKLQPGGEPIDPALVDFMVRTHRNGFLYKQSDFEVPPDVLTQALKAFKVSELDFGAFDIIWNNYDNKAYVLEVNTAPGASGNTVLAYVKEFKDVYGL